MQPPPKPRRPAPDARTLPLARQDIVPGIPRQAHSPRALEAAREAGRQSEPDLLHVHISARIDSLEGRVEDTNTSLPRVVDAVDGLAEKVTEWELKAAGGEAVKIQEEQKTKRWVALIGLLTMVVAPLGTVAANYLSRDTSAPRTITIQSSMQKEWEEKCAKSASDDTYVKCVSEIAMRNAPLRQH